MSVSSTKQIQLAKPADWPIWLSFVRMLAQSDGVWELVNPDQQTKPTHLSQPVEPEFDDSGDIDLAAYAKWKARMGVHKARMIKYEKQRDAFKQLIKHIQSTISAGAAILIAEEESHPYNLLRALRLRYAPTDQAKKMEIESKYRELCMGPINQDIEKWLDEWQQTYVTGKTLKVYEMTEERPIRDFIYSLMDRDEAWANAHIAVINHKVEENSLFNLISEFRNHTRMKASRKFHHSNSTHSAFSASTNQNRGGGGGPSFQGMGMKQPPECLCGENHWWVDCIYLNAAKRTHSWQVHPETARRVDEALKNSDTKDRVEKTIKQAMKKRNYHQTNQNQTKPEASGAFVADQQYYGVFTTAIATDNPLLSAWILDNGSNTHVCNKTMLHRFRKTRDAPPNGVLAGETRSNVEAFDEVDITVQGPEGHPWKITLRDVCYIPNFMTNVVAQRKFRSKGVYFDDQHMKLHAKGKTLGLVKHMYGHDVLEHASHEVIQSSTPEGVEMKGLEIMEVKKTEQISSRKQAYSGAPKRAEDGGDKAYHRAVSTPQEKSPSSKSPSSIKFGIFSSISPHWLGHRKKDNVKSGLISTNGITMTLPFQRRNHRFDWSRNQVWRKRDSSEVAPFDQKHLKHMEHMEHMEQPH